MGEPERLRRLKISPNTGTASGVEGAHQRDVAVAGEELNVGVDVVIGGDRVEDEVEAAGVLLHLTAIARDHDFIGPEAESVFLLARRSGENHDVRAERMSELHAHVSEAAEPHRADLLARGDTPMPHGRVGGDSGAEKRRGSGEIEVAGDARTKRSSTTMLSE